MTIGLKNYFAEKKQRDIIVRQLRSQGYTVRKFLSSYTDDRGKLRLYCYEIMP